ncbi:MAG: ORF6N domain-containing protein [Ferruginibacter sp.]
MNLQLIDNKIFEIRGQKVMLDFDLAALYEVETRILNQAIKRNIDKFPEDFMFRLTVNEWSHVLAQIEVAKQNNHPSSQIVMMELPKNRTEKYLPYAFTEHGVTMLASVLKSKKAINMNIAIVRAFIAMRHFANSHKDLFEQINDLRKEIQMRLGEHDTQLASIYDALENLLDKKQEEIDEKEKWKERQRIGFKK